VHANRRRRHAGEGTVAIVEEVSRRLAPWECVAQLLGGPCGRRVRRDRDVHHASPIVRQNDQHEQQATGRGRNQKEVRSHDLADVIPQEGTPSLGRRLTPPHHLLGDTGLTDRNAELEQFAMDARGASLMFATGSAA
jgi:hypothetical protein